MLARKRKIMTKLFKLLTSNLVILIISSFSIASAKPKELNVGYYIGWPTPNQKARFEKTYEKKLGMKVNWKIFNDGLHMTASIARGDIDIAFSQGVLPFVAAVSSGIPITTVAIAVSYANIDNCIVHKKTRINNTNAKNLEGKKIGVVFGTVSYFKLLKQLKHLGVNINKVHFVNRVTQPKGRYVSAFGSVEQQNANALITGELAMACGWGLAYGRKQSVGEVLLTPDELFEIGIITFDIISVGNNFMEKNGDVVVDILQVTEDQNKDYSIFQDYKKIANATKMFKSDTKDILNQLRFPSKEEQLDKWFNGTVAAFYMDVANVLAENFGMKVLPDYSKFVTTKYLKKVK